MWHFLYLFFKKIFIYSSIFQCSMALEVSILEQNTRFLFLLLISFWTNLEIEPKDVGCVFLANISNMNILNKNMPNISSTPPANVEYTCLCNKCYTMYAQCVRTLIVWVQLKWIIIWEQRDDWNNSTNIKRCLANMLHVQCSRTMFAVIAVRMCLRNNSFEQMQ